MSSLFQDKSTCNPDIGNWNTVAVTTMSDMFNGATQFNQNIDSWETAKVTSMSYMFSSARAFNQAIGNWNTAKVTSMAIRSSRLGVCKLRVSDRGEKGSSKASRRHMRSQGRYYDRVGETVKRKRAAARKPAVLVGSH
jgi:surface protein